MSSLQLLVGLVLLFIYEGYKSHYFDSKNITPSSGSPAATIVSGDDFTLNNQTARRDFRSTPSIDLHPLRARNQRRRDVYNNAPRPLTSSSPSSYPYAVHAERNDRC